MTHEQIVKTIRKAAPPELEDVRLFDIFKEHTGLTPSDWISRRRIKEACLLLETTDQPTNAVARSCGFTSPQYFNAVFKRRTGTTPTEWRQRNG